MIFTTNHIIKLFTDAVGQDAFADFYGTNWDARKKEIQKLQKSEEGEEALHRFIDILNDFTNWCKKKNYMDSWDYWAVCEFLIPYISASRFTPNNCIPIKDFIEYTTMYSICFTYMHSINEITKLKDSSDQFDALTGALMQFNYWLPSYDYTIDISPMEGVFNLLFEVVKVKRELIEFWNGKKAEIEDTDNPTDLNTQIKRWLNGKQRPTWKNIKLFLDESLLPNDSMIKDQIIEEIPNENLYLMFRRKVFPSCFITKFFDSLESQDLIHEETRYMIRNGVRLFYKHMLVDGGNEFSIEEKQNPMFCMMVHFLLYKDFGFDYNTDTAQYFKSILF